MMSPRDALRSYRRQLAPGDIVEFRGHRGVVLAPPSHSWVRVQWGGCITDVHEDDLARVSCAEA